MIETLLILIFAIFATLWKCKLRQITPASTTSMITVPGQSYTTGNAFDLPTTHLLKGICAIIVVLVHIPEQYQNPLQDAAGSFAYVAVTFFFFVSAYGMQYSLDHNPNYLKHFWTGRLSSLLIPLLFINIIASVFYLFTSPECTKWVHSLFSFPQYVTVLLEYCIFFYILNLLHKRFSFPEFLIPIILIILVIASSLGIYFNQKEGEFLQWPYERYGLIWGLLAYRYRHEILTWMNQRTSKKFFIFTAISLVLGVAYLKYKLVFFFGEYLLKIILGVSIITTLFLFSSKISLYNKVGKFLGDISYEVYLSHGIILTMLTYFLPSLSSGQMILLTFTGTILVSWPISRISKTIVKAIKRH